MIPRLAREKIPALLLVGALFLCHGIFGGLHLVCISPECADGVGRAAEHKHAAGAEGDENLAGHAAGTGYFAVLAGFLGLLVGLLSRTTRLRIRPESRRVAVLRPAPVIFRPARAPTSPLLQVFRL